MKRLYVSLGLVALLAVLCGLHNLHLFRFTTQLTGLLDQAQAQVEQENWEQAARLTRQAQSKWIDHEGYLHVTLRHADIDAVLVSFHEVLAFLDAGERQSAEYAAANARLITQIGLLFEAELPTLTNIF